MQHGHWYTHNRRFDGLEDAASVGLTSARRALRRLGARKIKTTRAPIVLIPTWPPACCARWRARPRDRRFIEARRFWLAGWARSRQRRRDDIDDGTMRGGLGSKPFDGEGLPITRKNLVERGVLKTYLLDSYSARRLGLASTGNAARSVGDAPSVSPTNLYLQPGAYSPERNNPHRQERPLR